VRRISWISSFEEADLEERRQALRDRRWARHKDMLRTIVRSGSVIAVTTSFAVGFSIGSAWDWLVHAIRTLVGGL
jgi:hypothetical protein